MNQHDLGRIALGAILGVVGGRPATGYFLLAGQEKVSSSMTGVVK